MGARGPLPTPTVVLAARGSRRARFRPGEPRLEARAPQAPSWLSAEARAVWDALVGPLEEAGIITVIDGHLLARYCDVWVRWREAGRFLDTHGPMFPNKDGNGQTKGFLAWPQTVMYQQLGALLSKMEGELGMSPSARARVVAAPAPLTEEEQSKPDFHAFLTRLH
jgi:P27 family predicted phage terminase small subunit